jgi:hypothetical protein
MRRIVTAAACLLLAMSVQARATVVVTVSKSQQMMSVVVDGSERYRWPVSTGMPGYPTPTGTWHPYRLEESWFSRKFDNAAMPHSVFFYYGYAVHGTLEESKLGQAVSHGCVRLDRSNAHTLFDLIKQQGFAQSKVIVTDGPLSGAGASPSRDPKPQRIERGPEARATTPPRASMMRDGVKEADLKRVYEKYGLKWQ